MALEKSKQKSYRGMRLDNSQRRILAGWSDEKYRKRYVEFCSEGGLSPFGDTFFGMLERDRLEAEKTGRDWPRDYRR